MPFNYGQAVLFYNKTAFKEAGLDPEGSPRTYAEFKDLGRDFSAGYQAFVAGNVAMLPFVSGYFNCATDAIGGKFELGIGYFPMLEKTQEGGSLLAGASFWLIDHQDETRKEASWDFMQYMASAEVQAKWTLKTGDILSRAWH